MLCLATVFPATTFATPPGNALQFDGVDDIVTVPHDDNLAFGLTDPATFEVWLRPTATPDIWHAFGKRTDCGSNAGIHYQLARDPVSLVAFGTSGCGVSLGEDLPLDEWSHLVISVDGERFRMYLNGEFKAERSCQLGSPNAVPLVFGNSDNCPARFPGQIDDVKIWREVRSPDQIADSFGCETDASATTLVGFWKFNEASDNQEVTDSSPSGFDGVLGTTSASENTDPTRLASELSLPCGVFKDGLEP